MRKLRELQQGIRRAVLEGDEAAIVSVIRGDGLDPAARLRVHCHHTATSLTAALRATYPVVCRLVDERFFGYAADAYIRANPPRGACLFEYGESFPYFLGVFPPCRDLAYLAAVARLEWAVNAALHSFDGAPLEPAELALTRAADRPHLVFRLQPSIRLLAANWPVDRIWQANQPGGDPALRIDEEETRLEIRQRNGGIAMRRLPPAVFAFRRALATRQTLAAAAEVALNLDPTFDLAAALAALLAEGAVAGITIVPPAAPPATEENLP